MKFISSLLISENFNAFQQTFLEELERTVALLAFEDVSTCPVGELLDISQRLKTASEVNAAILTSQSHEKGENIVPQFFLCFFLSVSARFNKMKSCIYSFLFPNMGNKWLKKVLIIRIILIS